MILLISSLQPKAQSPIDERFGRTKWLSKRPIEVEAVFGRLKQD